MGLFSNIARDGSSTPFSQAPPPPVQHGGYGPPGGGYAPPPVQARGGYGERESASPLAVDGNGLMDSAGIWRPRQAILAEGRDAT
jgi:hypothetical protein